MGARKDRSVAAEIVSAASQPFGIGVDATYVYWVNATDNTVRKAPKVGGASTIVTTLNAFNQGVAIDLVAAISPNRIAVDSSAIYWTDSKTIGRFPLP